MEDVLHVRNTGMSVKDIVLKKAGSRDMPLDRFDRLCETMDEVCGLVGPDQG